MRAKRSNPAFVARSDGLLRFARNDVESFEFQSAIRRHSRGTMPELCDNLSPMRGRRECRVPAGTRGLVCKMHSRMRTRAYRYSRSVIVNAIAALFFRQAEQTRLRATELYDRLRKDRQMTRAEAVVNTIEDSNIRSLAKAQIALHMVGLVPKEMDLTALISKAEKRLEEKSN